VADKDKPVVTFQENQDYLERIAAAKGTQVPLGGVAMPSIPRLDQPVDPEARWRGVQNQPNQARQTLSQEQMEAMRQQGVPLMQGVGSAYPFNQPALQNGDQKMVAPEGTQFANPPRPAGSGLRPETQQQLEALAKAQQPEAPKAQQPEDKDAKREKENTIAASVRAELDDLEDQFEVDEFGNRVRSLFLNKERREAIEKRCTPMHVEDLLINQEVRQDVPLIPGRLEVTYRSISGSEDLFVTRRMFGVKGASQYIMDLLSAMRLCSAIYAINRRPLPSHLKEGEPDEDLFKAKLALLMKYPIQLLADLSVNYSWFDQRVKRLLVIDEIKGF
jgi:hypothetical protein